MKYYQITYSVCIYIGHQEEHPEQGPTGVLQPQPQLPVLSQVAVWHGFFETMVHSCLESNKEKEGFQSYFKRTYIGVVGGRQRTRRQPIFAIATWNKYQDIVNDLELTNIKMEGFNSG
jgi:hypothetical protein